MANKLDAIITTDQLIERVARVLSYWEWPYAPQEARLRWANKHWEGQIPRAKAVLAELKDYRP